MPGSARRSGKENAALLSSIYSCREGFTTLILFSPLDGSTAVRCDCHDNTGRQSGACHAPVVPRDNVTGKLDTVQPGSHPSDYNGGFIINTKLTSTTRSSEQECCRISDEMSDNSDETSSTAGKAVLTAAKARLDTAADEASSTAVKAVFTPAEGRLDTAAEARIGIANLASLATDGADLDSAGKTSPTAEKTRLDITEKTNLYSSDKENSNLIQASSSHDKQESEGSVIVYGKPITEMKCQSTAKVPDVIKPSQM